MVEAPGCLRYGQPPFSDAVVNYYQFKTDS